MHKVALALVTKLLPQYTAPPPIPVLSPHVLAGGTLVDVHAVEEEHAMHVVPAVVTEIALQSNDDSQPLVASKSLLNLLFRHVESVVQIEEEEQAIHVVSATEIALQL